jgi:coatomer subunit beta
MPIEEPSNRYCHFIINNDAMVETPQSTELIDHFRKGTLAEKKKALQTLIKIISNDENYPRLLMPVLTNLQMNPDHGIKKLLFLYWEIVEKTKVDGTVKDEITLAVNALRKDLDSPNEYIRGRTLRLVSKINVQQIIDDLVDAVITNLQHRHCYVRRNAIMCIYAIYKNFGLDSVVNSIEDIENILITETDMSTKRNSFLLLFNLDQERALNYLKNLLSGEDPISEIGDIFQLVILEMLCKVCKTDPA